MSDLLRSLGIPVLEPYAESNLSTRARPCRHRQCALARQPRSGARARRAHSLHLHGRAAARRIPQRPRVAGRRRNPRQDHHHQHAGLDLPDRPRAQNPALEPSFLIGGVAENFGTSFQLRPTRTFIVEGDEYDTAFFDKGPKFLHYFPDALILTHVEFDHADIYADLEAVKTAFKRLVNLVPRRGLIVAYDGSENVSECVSRAFAAWSVTASATPRTGASAICAMRSAERGGRSGATAAVGRVGDELGRRAQRAERHGRGGAGLGSGH